jgi:hypothetical protein
MCSRFSAKLRRVLHNTAGSGHFPRMHFAHCIVSVACFVTLCHCLSRSCLIFEQDCGYTYEDYPLVVPPVLLGAMDANAILSGGAGAQQF